MFYHASNKKDLKILKPHVSMHGKSWVYFSTKIENVLVYLSNAVEKHIQQKHNRPLKQYQKWASYGITSDGRVRIEEYYQNATEDTFKGVSGYIYMASEVKNSEPLRGIKDVFVTKDQTKVDGCLFIKDAYEELLKAEKEGKIEIERFEKLTEKKKAVIEGMILKEYANTNNQDYKEFLIDKFDWLKDKFEMRE